MDFLCSYHRFSSFPDCLAVATACFATTSNILRPDRISGSIFVSIFGFSGGDTMCIVHRCCWNVLRGLYCNGIEVKMSRHQACSDSAKMTAHIALSVPLVPTGCYMLMLYLRMCNLCRTFERNRRRVFSTQILPIIVYLHTLSNSNHISSIINIRWRRGQRR